MNTEELIKSLGLEPLPEGLALHIATSFARDMIQNTGEVEMWYWAETNEGERVEERLPLQCIGPHYELAKKYMRLNRDNCRIQALITKAHNTRITHAQLNAMTDEQKAELIANTPEKLTFIIFTPERCIMFEAPFDLQARTVGNWEVYSDAKVSDQPKPQPKKFKDGRKLECPVCGVEIEEHMPGASCEGLEEPDERCLLLCTSCGALLFFATKDHLMQAQPSTIENLGPDRKARFLAVQRAIRERNGMI